MLKPVRAISFILLMVLIAVLGSPALSGGGRVRAGELESDELTAEELRSGRYFYMVDERGRTILITGHRLRIKDRFLDGDNDLYVVESVEGRLARARFVEKVKLNPGGESLGRGEVFPVQKTVRPAYKIALYHSHNAECYVPSDGTESIYGAGGIHDVGRAFKGALERKGVDVLYSEQLHLPHDRGAYRRSRATALRLLRERPDAIFDVHRDAAPWEKYALELDGESVTQIQIVVGLSNPGTATNQRFAYDLKGYADRLYPGLIHGVLLIWGSYNQDLSPLALLLEVGAHTNTKEAAMRGITRFAGVVSYYFYGPAFLRDREIAPPRVTPETAPADRPQYGIMKAFSGTILSLLLASTGAALGFYFLNNPDALARLYRWWEALPGELAVLGRRLRAFWHDLPRLMGALRRAAPLNLRRAWRGLRREGAILPRLLRRLGTAALQLGRQELGVAAALREGAPRNLRRAWDLLLREGRELPRLPGAIGSALREPAERLLDRTSSFLRESAARINRAGAGARAEAEILIGRLREYTLLLRNRLRP